MRLIPLIVPKDHSGQGLGGIQTNWIGPFTHAGGQTSNVYYAHPKTQSTYRGDNWGGGSVWYKQLATDSTKAAGTEIYPFLIQYYARFIGALYNDVGDYNSVDKGDWKVCDVNEYPIDQGKRPSQGR